MVNFLFIERSEDILIDVKKRMEPTNKNMTINVCHSISESLELVEKNGRRFDLIAVNACWDEETLYGLLGRLRKRAACPITVVTDIVPDDKLINIFSCGADGYVRIPVAINVLVALFESQVRRAILHPDFIEEIRYAGRMVFHNGLEIYPRGRFVSRNGVTIKLTTIEFDLLYYMARHADIVLTAEQLSDGVWGCKIDNNSSIYTQISRLRKKIEEDRDNPDYILTVHRHGYMFRSKR